MIIKDLCKTYEVSGRKLEVLKHLTLDLDNDGITVVLGRSGCGKTTLLRLIAGLEAADSGVISRTKGNGPPARTGVVFQEPRLMPWLTIRDNILFGIPKAERSKEQLHKLLELTGLTGFEKASPGQLSGGMKQRAALARALAYEPDYLLMDEPLAALDHFTRKQMQKELLKIHQTEKKGILFVTHSIDEALTIGTKIIILENGVSKQEYDLENEPFPRDMLSDRMIALKRDIINQIEENEDITL